jgi:hypothetical protein
MILVEFKALNKRIKMAKTTAIPICTLLRNFSSPCRRQISTQKLVVKAVKAESALEKDAATMPNVKRPNVN